jgi:hypothetical protein
MMFASRKIFFSKWMVKNAKVTPQPFKGAGVIVPSSSYDGAALGITR